MQADSRKAERSQAISLPETVPIVAHAEFDVERESSTEGAKSHQRSKESGW